MNKAARSDELRFEALFSVTASAYVVLDLGLTVIAVNDSYLGATRKVRDALVGRHIFDAFPIVASDVASNSISKLKASFSQVVESGQRHCIEVLKYPIKDPDSSISTFEDRYWRLLSTPVFADSGKLTHILHHVEDITERVLAQEALEQTQRRLAAMQDATGDVIYRMSPTWSHMHELDGRGFIKTTGKLAEYHIEDYVPVCDLERAQTAISEAIRTKTIFSLEHRVLLAGGGIGWTYSRAVPILDTNGAIVEWVGSASDITARKLAEERVHEASQRKDEFLAMLAHELRNPLAPISAGAELLRIASHDGERVKKTGELISRQVRHMTSLIDDLMDVSRVTRGLVKLEEVPVDMRTVISEAVEQVLPLINSRQHDLIVTTTSKSAWVVGDQNRLIQVVSNLLNNAAKYTPPSGKIVLSMTVDEQQVEVVVIDNGIGLAPDMAGRVFELFTQGERKSDRAQGGLGIGLALVKSLTDLHKGTVAVSSKGLSKGSSFTISLPRAVQELTRTSDIDEAPIDKSGKRKRVLVVDDNEDAAAMLALLLTEAGHAVTVAHDGFQGLKEAEASHPEICVLDIGLPDMDGKELAQRLRADSSQKVLLIAVTGYGQEEDRLQTSQAGFDYHFVKPVNVNKLLQIFGGNDEKIFVP